MDFIKELIGFMKERKKYWLIPLILTFAMIGSLLYISAGTVASPFIYTLF